jgi:hypothetical protein
MRFLGFRGEFDHDIEDGKFFAGGFGVHIAVGNMNTAMLVGVGSIAEDFRVVFSE